MHTPLKYEGFNLPTLLIDEINEFIGGDKTRWQINTCKIFPSGYDENKSTVWRVTYEEFRNLIFGKLWLIEKRQNN